MAHELETERLLMKQIEADDWSLFKDLHACSSVMKYISDENSEAEVRSRFDFRLMPWSVESEHWLCLAVVAMDSEETMGTAGFITRQADIREAEVGFLFLPEYQGKGYASETLVALIDYAKDLAFESMLARVVDGNDASKKLLLRKGFVLREVVPKSVELGGKFHDDYLYQLDLQNKA
jgi:RimJ/RimL family protein N-acetyltransferase